MDSSFNKNNGSLIFSTHYPELLDEYDRNDGIYIVRNRNGISVESLTEILKRNDVKKSDAYESGLLDGTTPAYAAYMKLKKVWLECHESTSSQLETKCPEIEEDREVTLPAFYHS